MMTDENIITTDKQEGGESQPGPIRLIGTLAVAGLISGIAIVGIYQATYATIAENKAKALRQAVFTVIPGITRMQEFVWRDGHLVAVDKEAEGEQSVYAGYDAEGNFVGYAVPGEGPGFQDTIELLYGYDPGTRKMTGMRVLESRETPGLGDKIIKDDDFVNQFSDLSVEPQIVLLKGTADEANEVDAITGATISSTAVVKILNNTNDVWRQRLQTAPPKSG